jgi:hypothetical protein
MPYADPEKYKEYQKEYQKHWFKDNPEKAAAKARRFHQTDRGKAIKRKCNLKAIFWTPELWEKTYKEQKGVCAVCGGASGDNTGRKLSADHDHKNKIPRGLLCGECNLMLGKAKDNPAILEAGALYLRKYSDAT